MDLFSLNTVPNLAGNAVGVALFALELIVVLFHANMNRDRWPGITYSMCAILEMIGYACRLGLRSSTTTGLYTVEAIFTALAPSFLSAGLYMHFAKYVLAYNREHYFIRSATFYCTALILAEFGARILQIVGSALYAQAAEGKANLAQPGRWVLLAGMCLQLVVVLFFLLSVVRICIKIRKTKHLWVDDLETVRSRALFNWVPVVVIVSSLFIVVRLIYRIILLASSSRRLSHEIYFLILDGLMILLAFVPVCVLYPGYAVARVDIRHRGRSEKGLDTSEDYDYDDEPNLFFKLMDKLIIVRLFTRIIGR